MPLQPSTWPYSEIKRQLAVNPVNPLMIPVKTFYITEVFKAQTKAPI